MSLCTGSSCCHCVQVRAARRRRAEMDDAWLRAALYPRRPALTGAAFWLPVGAFFIVGVVLPLLGYLLMLRP